LKVNDRVRAKDTEQHVVLAPRTFWDNILQTKLEKLADRKLYSKKCYRIEDTDVVISVTDRSQRDFTTQFEALEIDWTVIQKQLQSWSHLLQYGRQLRVNIAFNYVELARPSESSNQFCKRRRTDARTGSATHRMLSERALQLDAEETSTGEPSIWRYVYNLMRCPGPPCELGPHCWLDEATGKRYRLRTDHLKEMIRYVMDDNRLETHADVPVTIRKQLYAEEQQRAAHQRRSSGSKLPPIHITNVVPGSSPPSAVIASALDTPTSWGPRKPSCLSIPGPRDGAVSQYVTWQKLQVSSETLQNEFDKTGDITLEEGLDLELVYERQDYTFYVNKGVKLGIALRFVRDIEKWLRACNIMYEILE